MDRRSLLLGLGAGGWWADSAAVATASAIDLGRPDVIDFWRRSPPATSGDERDGAAPGRVDFSVPSPYVSAAARARLSTAELALLMRRLREAGQVLMKHPALSDPHGCSVLAHINIATNDSRENIEPEFIVEVRPLSLDNPKTQYRQGRYYTPTEASFLRVRLNPGHELARRRPQAMQAEGDLLYLRYGSSPALLLGDQAWQDPEQQIPDLIQRLKGDRSWFGGSPGPTAMEIYVGVSRHEGIDFYRGRLAPTYYVSRALAALLMTDWVGLRQRMVSRR